MQAVNAPLPVQRSDSLWFAPEADHEVETSRLFTVEANDQPRIGVTFSLSDEMPEGALRSLRSHRRWFRFEP